MMSNTEWHLLFSAVYWISLMTNIKYLIMLYVYVIKLKNLILILNFYFAEWLLTILLFLKVCVGQLTYKIQLSNKG